MGRTGSCGEAGQISVTWFLATWVEEYRRSDIEEGKESNHKRQIKGEVRSKSVQDAGMVTNVPTTKSLGKCCGTFVVIQGRQLEKWRWA